jgi:hypothetical protein
MAAAWEIAPVVGKPSRPASSKAAWEAAPVVSPAPNPPPESMQPDAPPAGAVPGSREYADYAAAQARAGKTLRQVGPLPPEYEADRSPLAKVQAATTGAMDAVPIAGPFIKSGAEQLKSSLYGVPVEQIRDEDARLEHANPISSGVGRVAGTVLPFIAGGEVPVLGTALGQTGSLAARVGFGGLTGGIVSGADTAVRGGTPDEIVKNMGIGAGFGAALPAVTQSAGSVIQRLMGNSAPKQVRNVAAAMRDDGIDPSTVTQQLMNMGEDARVMDLSPNLQQQAGALASVPGKAQKQLRQVVEERRAGAAGRVQDDIERTVGSSPDMDALHAQITGDQKAAAAPLYDAVRDVPVPPNAVAAVMNTPLGKRAFARAAEIAANDGKPANQLTIGLVDYAKQALDDVVTTAKRTGENVDVRQAGNLARALTSAADAIDPRYAAARAAYAGPAKVLDAIEEGKGLLSKDVSPTQLQTRLAALSPSETDGLLAGFQSQVESALGNSGNDVAAVRNMFRKPWNEAKLRVLLGDDVANDVMQSIERELKFGQTSNVVSGNSETARRLAAQGLVNPQMQDLGYAPQSTFGFIISAINKARAVLRQKMQPKVNERMANILTARAGDIDPRLLRQMQNAGRTGGNAILPPGAAGVGGAQVVNNVLSGDIPAPPHEPLRIVVGGGGQYIP